MTNVQTATRTWLDLVKTLMEHGSRVAPRRKWCRELPQHTVVVDMAYPVVNVPARGLNYRFMAAEAYWILTGCNSVETIAPYNSRIVEFSDDGKQFFGAYGPRIMAQLSYVVGKLVEDLDTRQAGLTIWRENPPKTKDMPCTVAIFFSVRHGVLNTHVFMRSSDAWLGVPYDIFSFSMLTNLVAARVNNVTQQRFRPGKLYLTAASSHLYEDDVPSAETVLLSVKREGLPRNAAAPPRLSASEPLLLDYLRNLREKGNERLRWWVTAVDEENMP